MPPSRTAPGIASTSKASKGKAAAAASTSTAASAAVDASSILPDLPLPASFSRAQAQKAVNALLTHAAKVAAEKEENELMPTEEHIWLTIGLKSGAVKKKVSPVRIQLPHPALPPPPATSVCLLTKDPQREYKDLLEKQGIKFVSRVVGVAKLKGKFKPFEARRQLMKDHEMFLCDERVVGLMPKLLGKIFYESKKLPIPVNLKKKDLKTELAKAVNSTYFVPSTGTALSIRIATPSSSTPQTTLLNLLTAIPPVIANISGGWENVLSIGIKTSSSVLLPVWSSSLAGRFEHQQSAAAAAAAAKVNGKTEGGEKKEKRKGVFDEWAAEQKEEAERAIKYLLENGEEVPEELERVAKGLKRGAGGKGKIQRVNTDTEGDDDDEEDEEEDEEMDGESESDDEDAAVDVEEEDEEEAESESASPEAEAPAPAAPAPVKSSTTTKVRAGKPVAKYTGKKTASGNKIGGKARQAVLGSGAGKRK